MFRARHARWLLDAGVCCLVATSVTSCSGGDPPVYPGADSPSYRGSPAQFAKELRTLADDLQAVSGTAAPGTQERTARACDRLDGYRDTFQHDIPSRRRAGISDAEFILLYGAANSCHSDPMDAGATIEHLLTHRALRSETPSGAPTPG